MGKNQPNFLKSSQNSLPSQKDQNINTKVQVESLKHQNQTTFETLKYFTTNHVLRLIIAIKMSKNLLMQINT